MIKVVRGECSGIARVETKAPRPGAVVYGVFSGLVWARLRYGLHDLLQGMVEGQEIVERLIEYALSKLVVVVANMIEVHG